jgi:ATP-dependent DNA helicase RecG
LAIENAINDNIQPVPSFQISSVKYENKDILILLVLKGDFTPYRYKGKAYRRQDTASIAVDPITLNQLILQGSNLTFEELKSSVTHTTFELLKDKLQKRIDLGKFDEDTLRTLGLMSFNDITNAGNLLSDRPNYPYGIDIVRFGENDSIFLDRKELIGISILEQYLETLDYFDLWYAPYEEVVGFYREERIRIPREAFREALANAIIHRDYLLPGSIKISMYPERIEIISPGGFVSGIPLEVFETREISLQRNRNIADVFRRLGIVEKYGTGFKRMKNSYKDFRQRPLFAEEDGAFVSVTLPVVTYANSPEELNNYEYQVFQFIKMNPSVSSSEIQKNIGGAPTTLKRTLNKLIANEKIQRIGKGRGTKYLVQ